MTPNRARRSQRTEGSEPHLEATSSPRTDQVKRGANTAYLTSRLARDYPKILERLHAGEFPSVRAASKAAGLIKELTPLEQLERWWQRANADDRAAFWLRIQAASDWRIPATRAMRKKQQTGDRWYEALAGIRQHVAKLTHTGILETMVKKWAPRVRQGYRAELRRMIEHLQSILARLEEVDSDGAGD